jgi:signal transduction histidine kinase
VRAQGRPFADVDVEQLARTVVRELEGGSLPDGTQLAVSGAGSTLPPVVHADSPQLRLLVEQLLDNALKFRGEQRPARVHVNVTRAPGDGGAGDVVRLTVRDEGIGFDERFLDRIFAPFQRLHGRDAYGGTGMGLALCQHVVERHGGTLTAHSSPGSGATFTATLPAAAPAPSAA